MRTEARYLMKYLYMTAVMLCFVLALMPAEEAHVMAQVPESEKVTSHVCEDPSAMFRATDDDRLKVAHEMGQWGLPSTLVNLQGAAGRGLTLGQTQQRIGGANGLFCAGTVACANKLPERVGYIVSAKQFHSGYYLYYRCQMRC